MPNNLNKKPLVSIITVCLNSEKTIERTIKSVLNQTYSNIEYIIIDGGSKDETLNIIKKYENKIAQWISEPDQGIYDAMNKGIKKATGEIIGILNSDDVYVSNAIQNVVDAFYKHSEAKIVYGNYIIVSFWKPKTYFKRKNIGGLKIDLKCFHFHPTTFVKKEIYQKYGIFDKSFQISGDGELLLRFYVKGVQFVYLNKILTHFAMGGNSQIKISWEPIKIYFKHLKKYQAIIQTMRYFIFRIPLSLMRLLILNKINNQKIKKIIWRIRYAKLSTTIPANQSKMQ